MMESDEVGQIVGVDKNGLCLQSCDADCRPAFFESIMARAEQIGGATKPVVIIESETRCCVVQRHEDSSAVAAQIWKRA